MAGRRNASTTSPTKNTITIQKHGQVPRKPPTKDGENGSDKIIYCNKSVDVPVREGEDWDKEAAQTAAAGAQLKREELQNVRIEVCLRAGRKSV